MNIPFEKVIDTIHSVRYGGLPTHYPSITSWDLSGENFNLLSLWDKKFKSESREPLGLYINIPFCRTRCSFCFLDVMCDLKKIDEYMDLLEKEASFFMPYRPSIDSVYIGGGTPNILSARNIERLLNIIHKNFNPVEKCEIIMESNPDFWDDEKLIKARAGGVSLIITGVQTFNLKQCRDLNRHQIKDPEKLLRKIKKYGFKLSVDLLAGISDPKTYSYDLKKIASVKPDQIHINRLKPVSGKYSQAEKKKLIGMQNAGFSYLESYGYSRIDEDSCSLARYNSGNVNVQGEPNYQIYSSIIGLGIGAMGHIFSCCRYVNEANIKNYRMKIESNRLPSLRHIVLKEKEEIIHYFLVNIGLKGVHISDMKKKFSPKAVSMILKKASVLRAKGLICSKGGYFKVNGDAPDFFSITKILYQRKYMAKIAERYGLI